MMMSDATSDFRVAHLGRRPAREEVVKGYRRELDRPVDAIGASTFPYKAGGYQGQSYASVLH